MEDIELTMNEIAAPEEIPKMSVYMDEYNVPEMFRAAFHTIRDAKDGFVYVVFGMGSVKLDISNPQNAIDFNSTYVEIFNAENLEITMLKISKVDGFVFEPKPEPEPAVDIEELEE